MKVVTAIDSFKGSMTSLEVATAAEKGVLKVYPNAEVVKIPLADGGEGTVDSLADALNGKIINIKVHDPLMREIDSFYGLSKDKKTGIIEMAAASGLPLLKPEERNPLRATTYGVGELIKDAIKNGCREFIIGIGGSATNDGGIGMLTALGYEFLDKEGRKLAPIGENLNKITDFVAKNVLSELSECKFLIACDVDNPLCGERGASNIYGRQKGATEDMIKQLDNGLRNFANVVKDKTGKDIIDIAGAGAAGGLGGAFLGFLNSELKPGIDIVMEKLELEDAIKDATYVITGEGKIDVQSMMGKTISGVARIAKRYDVPVIAIGGGVDDNIESIYDSGIVATFSIMDSPMTLEQAMETSKAARLVEKTVEQIFRIIKINVK